ncbi:MAG: hypothetical protein K2Q22_13070 [Cytophagales bacterium]|nr:hypothetical protein [Cytophagales bacterium]
MSWGFIKELFSGGKLLDGARGIIDEVVTSKEEKAELALKLEQMLKQHEQEIIRAENEDRISARNREVEVVRSGSRNITQNLLAYIGVIAFFGITGYILSKGLGNMNTEESFIVGNLTGMAGAIAKDIFGYYFGSSKGEREVQRWKNDIKH